MEAPIPDWVVELAKAGGLALFAGAVWWELRHQRIERNQRQELEDKRREVDVALLGNIRVVLERMVERDRMRTPPHGLPIVSLPPDRDSS